MAAEKDVLGLIDFGRKISGPALVGVEPLHQRPMRASDLIGARAGFQAKDLIGFLFGHMAAARASAPRRRVSLRVLTPAGLPAVKIRN